MKNIVQISNGQEEKKKERKKENSMHAALATSSYLPKKLMWNISTVSVIIRGLQDGYFDE